MKNATRKFRYQIKDLYKKTYDSLNHEGETSYDLLKRLLKAATITRFRKHILLGICSAAVSLVMFQNMTAGDFKNLINSSYQNITVSIGTLPPGYLGTTRVNGQNESITISNANPDGVQFVTMAHELFHAITALDDGPMNVQVINMNIPDNYLYSGNFTASEVGAYTLELGLYDSLFAGASNQYIASNGMNLFNSAKNNLIQMSNASNALISKISDMLAQPGVVDSLSNSGNASIGQQALSIVWYAGNTFGIVCLNCNIPGAVTNASPRLNFSAGKTNAMGDNAGAMKYIIPKIQNLKTMLAEFNPSNPRMRAYLERAQNIVLAKVRKSQTIVGYGPYEAVSGAVAVSRGPIYYGDFEMFYPPDAASATPIKKGTVEMRFYDLDGNLIPASDVIVTFPAKSDNTPVGGGINQNRDASIPESGTSGGPVPDSFWDQNGSGGFGGGGGGFGGYVFEELR